MKKYSVITGLALFIIVLCVALTLSPQERAFAVVEEASVSYYIGDNLVFSALTPVGGAYELDNADVPTGYEFSGWYLYDETPFVTPYSGDSLKVYARFDKVSEIEKVTITLVSVTEETPIEIVKGSVPELISPTFTEYDFLGWFSDETFETPYTGGAVSTDCRLYAKTERKSFSVCFFGSGGRIIAEKKVLYGENAVPPTENVEEDGFEFSSWKGTMTNITENTSIFAVYVKIQDILYRDSEGNTITLAPEKAGYEFVGWERNETNETVFFTPSYRKLVYAIDVHSNEGGRAECKDEAFYADTININVIPFSGYSLERLYIKYNGTEYPITDNTFIMPPCDVELYSEFSASAEGIVNTTRRSVGKVSIEKTVVRIGSESEISLAFSEVTESDKNYIKEKIAKEYSVEDYELFYFKMLSETEGTFRVDFSLSENDEGFSSYRVAVYSDGRLFYLESQESPTFSAMLPTNSSFAIIALKPCPDIDVDILMNEDKSIILYLIAIIVLSIIILSLLIYILFGRRISRGFRRKRKPD